MDPRHSPLEALAEQRATPSDPDAVKRRILDTVSDLVAELLHHGRKEDPDLPPGAIEAAVAAGAITVEEIAATFRDGIAAALPAGAPGDRAGRRTAGVAPPGPKYAVGDRVRYLGGCPFEPAFLEAGQIAVVYCVPEEPDPEHGQIYLVHPLGDRSRIEQVVCESCLAVA